MNYNTNNKKIIIDLLKENKDKHLTIDQISTLLKNKNNNIPIASIYRIIDFYVNKNIIRKYTLENNTPACFQYIDENNNHQHFHLLCSKCGKLIHLECDEVEELLSHIEKKHHFKVDVSRINLYGVCKDCNSKK